MPRVPKDKQIIVRATEAEIERWFLAARIVCATRGEKVSLSVCVRRELSDWAERVIKRAGGK
jgi:hypothetical protein